MNIELDIVCDRCGKTVHGLVIEEPGVPRLTGGFYDVSCGAWSEFARPSEKSVCDPCMWEDPKFKKQYPGVNRKIPNK